MLQVKETYKMKGRDNFEVLRKKFGSLPHELQPLPLDVCAE
jgi:hypothetical protein